MIIEDLPFGSGDDSPIFAEAIMAREGGGGVVSKFGPISAHADYGNGYGLIRQHFDGSIPRPAPTPSPYPRGLLLQGVGAEANGYGTADSGGGIYVNLSRDKEGSYSTSAWQFAIDTPVDGGVGVIYFYRDTEAWGSTRRSYFGVRVTLATGEVAIQVSQSAGWIVVGTTPVAGWNDVKYNRVTAFLTTYTGPSEATGTNFGRYVSFQIFGKVYDLRNAGGGWAQYNPSGQAQEGSSFSGGDNDGIAFTTPLPGVRGGLVLMNYARTLGDTIV